MERVAEMKLWFLGTWGIIESAMTIPFRNPYFIALTLITSFPLFSMRLIRRLPYDYQPSLIMEASDQLRSLTYHSNPLISDHMSGALDLAILILEVYLLYFANFLIALATIHAASTIYTSSERSAVTSLRNLLQNSVTKTRWQASAITLLSVSLLCSLSFSAVQYWHYARPLLSPGCPTRLSRAVHWIVYGVAFAKWLEYSARWNLSLVVSILEENRGSEAISGFSASSKLTKGNRLRGFSLMLLYSVWSFNLPTLLARWTFPSIFAYYFLDTSFLCLGKVMNWVILTVYYYDCKNCHKRLP